MIRIIYFLLSIVIFIGCQSKQSTFNCIDFAYFNSRPEAYKIRVTSAGIFYIKKDWGSSEKDFLDTFSIYKGILSDSLRDNINDLVAKTNFKQLDSLYDEGSLDGEYLEYFFSIPPLEKHIIVMDNGPNELKLLTAIFKKIRYSFHLEKVDTLIKFRALPPPPPPLIEENNP